MTRDDRERFEQEYRDWIRLMSKDAACRLEALPADKKKAVLKAYEEFQSWSEFSSQTYDLFVREVLLNLTDANRGYG